MELDAKSILGLHAFIGCDTTNACCGKCKVKPLKIFLKSRIYIVKFANIFVNASLGGDPLKVFQQFACDLYGHKGERTKTLRYRLYSSKRGKLEAKIFLQVSTSYMLHVQVINNLCGTIV